MRSLLTIAAFVLTFLAFDATAHALSCQQRVVNRGDTAAEVLILCGEPLQRVTRLEQRSQAVTGAAGAVVSVITRTTQVDVWVYDFGRNRLMRELTFRDGQLANIRSLGYGRGPRASIQLPRSETQRLASSSAILWRRDIA